MHIIKAVASLLVLGAVLGTAHLVQDYAGSIREMPGAKMEERKQLELVLRQKAERGARSSSEPGEKAFQRARELLESGSMAEAEEKLKYIVSFYPAAEAAAAARKVLGEMNIDRLLDPDWKEGKRTVLVKKGDNFTKIIRQNETTMASLMHLSKLMRADHQSLRPGDKLTVMPLNLRLVIDLRRQTLTLWRQGEFIKEYPIRRTSYRGRGTVRHLKVGSLMGEEGGKLFPGHLRSYRYARKLIFLSDKSLAIRPFSADNVDELQLGFYLAEVDTEELSLLLRPGNAVEIRQ